MFRDEGGVSALSSLSTQQLQNMSITKLNNIRRLTLKFFLLLHGS
jgi:hypothetical protein